MRILTTSLLSAAALATLAGAAAAEPEPPTFQVIKPNVSIPWAQSSLIDMRRVGEDTLLLRMRGGGWYRAELTRGCASEQTDLSPYRFETDALGTLDTFSFVETRFGKHCKIERLDQIAPPAKPHG